MAAGHKTICDIFSRQHCAERQAAAQGLGQRQDIRLDAEVFIAEKFAGATHAGLHFVENQQQPALIAQLAQAEHVNFIGHDDAALGLDRLDEDRDGFLRVDSGFNRV